MHERVIMMLCTGCSQTVPAHAATVTVDAPATGPAMALCDYHRTFWSSPFLVGVTVRELA